MSASDPNAPETRTDRRSSSVWMAPDGRTTFCALQGGEKRAAVDAEICEFLDRELDEDPLVLRADDLDLRDVGHEKQTRADLLDLVAQFATREAVRGEAVDDAERVAEAVVEDTGPTTPCRQGEADVGDEVADLIPGILHLRPRARTASG